MEKIEISKNMYLCRFEKALGNFVGLNVFVIQNGNKALLIDTGFEHNYLEIKEYLNKKNIEITKTVVTHFHPDHMGGLKHLNNVDIYGSEFAKDTLKKFNKKFDHLLPNIIVEKELKFTFGKHTIKLEENKGHSIDGILITIDDKFLYVGDDMVFSHKGVPLVPLCADRNIENHILSIEKIYKNYKNKIIIPSHGIIIKNQSIIKKDLEDRLKYLKYVQQNPNCSVEEFKKNTGIKLFGENNHKYNTNREVKQYDVEFK